MTVNLRKILRKRKVKVVGVQVTNTYGGSRNIAPFILNLDTTYM